MARSLGVSATVHVSGSTATGSFPMADRDKAVLMLDGDGGHASVIADRAGIELLVTALQRARAELDAAQEEMAAQIASTHDEAAPAGRIKGAA